MSNFMSGSLMSPSFDFFWNLMTTVMTRSPNLFAATRRNHSNFHRAADARRRERRSDFIKKELYHEGEDLIITIESTFPFSFYRNEITYYTYISHPSHITYNIMTNQRPNQIQERMPIWLLLSLLPFLHGINDFDGYIAIEVLRRGGSHQLAGLVNLSVSLTASACSYFLGSREDWDFITVYFCILLVQLIGYASLVFTASNGASYMFLASLTIINPNVLLQRRLIHDLEELTLRNNSIEEAIANANANETINHSSRTLTAMAVRERKGIAGGIRLQQGIFSVGYTAVYAIGGYLYDVGGILYVAYYGMAVQIISMIALFLYGVWRQNIIQLDQPPMQEVSTRSLAREYNDRDSSHDSESFHDDDDDDSSSSASSSSASSNSFSDSEKQQVSRVAKSRSSRSFAKSDKSSMGDDYTDEQQQEQSVMGGERVPLYVMVILLSQFVQTLGPAVMYSTAFLALTQYYDFSITAAGAILSAFTGLGSIFTFCMSGYEMNRSNAQENTLKWTLLSTLLSMPLNIVLAHILLGIGMITFGLGKQGLAVVAIGIVFTIDITAISFVDEALGTLLIGERRAKFLSLSDALVQLSNGAGGYLGPALIGIQFGFPFYLTGALALAWTVVEVVVLQGRAHTITGKAKEGVNRNIRQIRSMSIWKSFTYDKDWHHYESDYSQMSSMMSMNDSEEFLKDLEEMMDDDDDDGLKQPETDPETESPSSEENKGPNVRFLKDQVLELESTSSSGEEEHINVMEDPSASSASPELEDPERNDTNEDKYADMKDTEGLAKERHDAIHEMERLEGQMSTYMNKFKKPIDRGGEPEVVLGGSDSEPGSNDDSSVEADPKQKALAQELKNALTGMAKLQTQMTEYLVQFQAGIKKQKLGRINEDDGSTAAVDLRELGPPDGAGADDEDDLINNVIIIDNASSYCDDSEVGSWNSILAQEYVKNNEDPMFFL
jgi:hypothetical protein